MRVYFIRHGESENNSKGVFTGQMDVPLTSEGIRQAEDARSKFSGVIPDKIYSSDLIRAVETARTVFPGFDVETDSRLREIDVGSLSGKPTKEFRKNNPDMVPFLNARDYTPFGGENDSQVLERLSDFVRELSGEDYETVAIFCHGGVLHTSLELALGVSFSPWRTSRPNCAVVLYELSRDGEMTLITWNK